MSNPQPPTPAQIIRAQHRTERRHQVRLPAAAGEAHEHDDLIAEACGAYLTDCLYCQVLTLADLEHRRGTGGQRPVARLLELCARAHPSATHPRLQATYEDPNVDTLCELTRLDPEQRMEVWHHMEDDDERVAVVLRAVELLSHTAAQQGVDETPTPKDH